MQSATISNEINDMVIYLSTNKLLLVQTTMEKNINVITIFINSTDNDFFEC